MSKKIIGRRKRIHKIKLLCILGLFCVFFFGVGTKAQASTIYQTNFNHSKGWQSLTENSANQWKNENGNFSRSSSSESSVILRHKKFRDIEYNADVTVNKQASAKKGQAEPGAGIIFRVQKPSSGVKGYEGYYFGIDVAKQEVIFGKTSNNTWQQIATKKMTLKYGEAYNLKVRVAGDHIQGFVDYEQDNYPRVDVTDQEFKIGSIGLSTNSATASFDNVDVSTYHEQPIYGPTYQNALLPDAADPDVSYYKGTYYLYCTTPGEEVGGIKVYTSTDLTNWTDKGLAMKKGPNNWGESGFWAPDLIERNGKFYMYYVANEHLNVSISNSPLGPFKQKKVGPMHTDTKEIDAHTFKDDDGQYYLYFVRFDNGNVIWGAKLNDDMLSIDEKSLTKLLVPSQPWEKDMANINEGPYMLKKDGTYFLTYSGSHFESPLYGSGYATSKSPLGPYNKYKNNPIMQSNAIVHGTGHHGITTSPDGKELFMVYHRHFNLNQANPRQFAIDRMRFNKDEDGKTVLEVHGPTVTKQPIPSGAVDANNFIESAPLAKNEITIPQYSSPHTWKLPRTIDILTSKSKPGENLQVRVLWNLLEYNPYKRGKQKIHGVIILPRGTANLGKQNLRVSITINTTPRNWQANDNVQK